MGVSGCEGARPCGSPGFGDWAATCHFSHQGAAEGSSSAPGAGVGPSWSLCFGQGEREGGEEAQRGHSGPAEESGLGSRPGRLLPHPGPPQCAGCYPAVAGSLPTRKREARPRERLPTPHSCGPGPELSGLGAPRLRAADGEQGLGRRHTTNSRQRRDWPGLQRPRPALLALPTTSPKGHEEQGSCCTSSGAHPRGGGDPPLAARPQGGPDEASVDPAPPALTGQFQISVSLPPPWEARGLLGHDGSCGLRGGGR